MTCGKGVIFASTSGRQRRDGIGSGIWRVSRTKRRDRCRRTKGEISHGDGILTPVDGPSVGVQCEIGPVPMSSKSDVGGDG